MAGIKISLLPTVSSALFTDFYPAVQAGVTSKETLLQVATLFGFDSGTHLLALDKGGTNAALTAALGAVPYSTADAFAFLAPGTSGQLLQSQGSAAPIWTTATYPTTASTSGKVIVSDGTNFSSSFTTGITGLGTQSQALNMGSHLINNVTDPVSAQDAATKNYVDQHSLIGTAVYAASAASLGTVTQSGTGVGATLTNAGAQATFSLDGVNPPAGSNVLIKNTATGMTTANEGIYTVTNAGSGVTNWVLTRATTYDTPTEINNIGLIVVQNGSTLAGTTWYNTTTIVTVDTTAFSYSQFGSYPLSLANGGTAANLTAITGGLFYSTASAGAISSTMLYSPTVSAVNGITFTDNIASGAPSIAATGSDSNITLQIKGKGTGGAAVLGTSTNDNASSGYVGEVISSNVASGSAIPMTSSVILDVTSITLTPGDWDVFGNVALVSGVSTIVASLTGWINTTSVTMPDASNMAYLGSNLGFTGGDENIAFTVPHLRVSVSSPTDVYLSCVSNFTTSTNSVCGNIFARRAR